MWGRMSVGEERIIARVLWSMRKYRPAHGPNVARDVENGIFQISIEFY
jgi:hypothetical protein